MKSQSPRRSRPGVSRHYPQGPTQGPASSTTEQANEQGMNECLIVCPHLAPGDRLLEHGGKAGLGKEHPWAIMERESDTWHAQLAKSRAPGAQEADAPCGGELATAGDGGCLGMLLKL